MGNGYFMPKVVIFGFQYGFSKEVCFVFKVLKVFETMKCWHLSLAAYI